MARPRTRLTRSLALGLVVASATLTAARAADEPAPKNVSDLVARHDRQLTRDLLAYLAAHPRADDVDQAYMAFFDKVIEHDWFADHEKDALRYLTENPNGAVRSLAQIVTTMARAQAEDYPEAYARYLELMNGLGKPEQEEFASNFADSLAREATAAGQYPIARHVYETLLARYGESPTLRQKVKDELERLGRVGKPAPEVVARDVKGDPFRLDTYRGKYVLIDFWATWCAPWVADLAPLQATYKAYRPLGFEIVGVSLDETKDAVLDFAKARDVPWRQVHNPSSEGDLVNAFGVITIPATFLIDPDGVITRLDVRGKALDRALEQLLKGGKPAGAATAVGTPGPARR